MATFSMTKYELHNEAVFGERAKRARRYLVMLMEVRDNYIYIQVKKKQFKINAKI